MKLNRPDKIKRGHCFRCNDFICSSFIIFFLQENQNAFAGDMAIDITNNLQDEALIFNKVENRQDVQLKSDPPNEVPALQSGGFKIAKGDSEKSPHLKVQYYVGEKGSDETVTFGFKGDTWSSISCFTETPDDIDGSHENCDKGNKKFFLFSQLIFFSNKIK